MSNYKKWTDSEIDYIRDNHTTIPDQELASKLSQITTQNITMAMIRRQRRKLKLSKPRGRPLKKKNLSINISSVNEPIV
jgi:hypothetical protein